MPQVGFEPTTLIFEWAKIVHALDRAATFIGNPKILQSENKDSALLKQQTTSVQNHPQTDLDLWYPTLGHGFHIKHRDPGALPIEGPAHDSGRTVVCAEHSYPARPSDSIS
jgi:hypothetical protein